jgi:MFS family permease
MLGDGLAFSVMVGVGESYLPAFVLALGHDAVLAGLVATLPMLAGALLQLVSPAAVGLLRSHRRWVVLCAALQAASFVPLIAGSLAGAMDAWLVFAAAALYWGFGMSTGPAWNVWASTLVPARIRPRYFARRARWSQASLVTGLLAGGLALQGGERWDEPVRIFAVVFATALVARALSAGMLAAQSEALPVPIGETRISPRVIRSHLSWGDHGRLLGYLLVFQMSVWIAAPYFTPYMLGPLGLSYFEYTCLTATAFLARVVALPALGAFVARSGTRRTLWLGSLGIVPLPLLWLVSDSFAWLLALQVAGGTAWAAFELASLLAFFEHIPMHGRTSVLTVFNLANAFAIVAGGAIGGLLLHVLPEQPVGYVVVLVLSSATRLACLPLLRGVSVHAGPGVVPTLRTLTVRPSTGGIQRPVLPSLDEAEDTNRTSDDSQSPVPSARPQPKMRSALRQ